MTKKEFLRISKMLRKVEAEISEVVESALAELNSLFLEEEREEA